MKPRIRFAVSVLLFLVPSGGAAAESPLLQSFDLDVPRAPTPFTVAGRAQLVYELRLVSFGDGPLVLQRVEVIDAHDGAVIDAFARDDLERRLYRPGASEAPDNPLSFDPGTLGVVYIELSLDDGDVPGALAHRVAFLRRDVDQGQSAVINGAVTPVQTEPPVVLSPPLRDGPWAAIHDPSWTRGHRRVIYAVDGRAVIPGRHAIDWIRLDDEGRLARGDEDEVRNWHGYNADVLAVADGVVAATRDDVAESATVSGHPDHPLEDATGNYIALELGHGRFVFYEHLKPGSVRVEPGERVARGQVIGSLGFTGDSTGPHLHFHVADANSPLGADGLPFFFDKFTLLGVYDDFDKLGSAPWTPLDGKLDTRRTKELPGPNVVVQFEN